ncbi:hypothetical protein LJR027_000094 [Terrabacter sp. LjRoot27]
MRNARRYMIGLAVAAFAVVGLVGAPGAQAVDGPQQMCAGKSFC